MFHETLMSALHDTHLSIHKHTRVSHNDLLFSHLEQFIQKLIQGDETSPSLKADTQKTPTTPVCLQQKFFKYILNIKDGIAFAFIVVKLTA